MKPAGIARPTVPVICVQSIKHTSQPAADAPDALSGASVFALPVGSPSRTSLFDLRGPDSQQPSDQLPRE